jgi:hypothetical protein
MFSSHQHEQKRNDPKINGGKSSRYLTSEVAAAYCVCGEGLRLLVKTANFVREGD